MPMQYPGVPPPPLRPPTGGGSAIYTAPHHHHQPDDVARPTPQLVRVAAAAIDEPPAWSVIQAAGRPFCPCMRWDELN